MAGRRSLTQEEERRLLRAVRAMEPRDRALVTAQWMTGFRIGEVLSWTVGTVMRNGALVSKIGLPPPVSVSGRAKNPISTAGGKVAFMRCASSGSHHADAGNPGN